MRTAIVTTTINIPILLKNYCLNICKHGHKNVEIIIIQDKKTPREIDKFCDQLQSEHYLTITNFTLNKQLQYLKKYPQLKKILPWNSIQRRNLGFLYAIEKSFDFVITLDDDNFIFDNIDFIGAHIFQLGEKVKIDTVTASNGWFNCIDMLHTDFNKVYPRGFPLSKRWQNESVDINKRIKKCVVNEGLWIGNPDIDALTRIYYPVATYLPLKFEYLALNSGTWCPINSQNTAFTKDSIIAAFLIIMGKKINGLKISRYDDIFMGWFLQTVTEHLGEAIRYGNPIVKQDRNYHNCFTDLRQELPGMEINESIIEICRSSQLTSSTYIDCYIELAEHLRSSMEKSKHKDFGCEMTDQMLAWASSVRRALI